MAMKVYGLPMSTNVARVLVCLEEAGAQYEVIPIDFSTAEHKSPEHTSRNPFGQVPALQDGDLILFESRAISKYVLRKNNSELLKEYNISESAKVDVWLEVESHQFDIPMAVVIYQCLILPVYFGGETDVKVVEENLEKLKKTFQVYEKRLFKFKYLAGDFLSLADLSHFPSAYYLLATPHATILDEFPLVNAWVTDMLARPTVKKVIEMMKATA
uniref:glutathione transferase n=1 Tax=Leersia perrieri TaxID=77586 RepID=A0A0D9V160_9ORYZ